MKESGNDKLNIEIFLCNRAYNFAIDRDEEEAYRKGASLYKERLQTFYSFLEKNVDEGDITRNDILVLLGYEFATRYADLLLSADSTDKILNELLDKMEK